MNKNYIFRSTSEFKIGDLIGIELNFPTLMETMHGEVKECYFIRHNPINGLDEYEIKIEVIDDDINILKQLKHIEEIQSKIGLSVRGK